MGFATGFALLAIGAMLVWAAAPGRMGRPVPTGLLRAAGAAAIAIAAIPFVRASGAVAGGLEWLTSLCLLTSATALGAPLHPRLAPWATGAVVLAALALEVVR